MSRSQATVSSELLQIDPPGDAVPGNVPGAMWPLWCTPLAAEISRFEGYAEQMLVEVNPGQANYLLADYVRVLGPDPYGRDSVALTTAQQQSLALQRWTATGGASIGYFEEQAAAIGLTITITEQPIWECGHAVCGDAISCSPQELSFLVTLPASSAGTFEGNAVEAMITADAPAHTQPVFSYTG